MRNQDIRNLYLIHFKDNHLIHLTLWTKQVSATPNPSPTGLQVASITQLLLAEEEHLNFCLESCITTDDETILKNIKEWEEDGKPI